MHTFKIKLNPPSFNEIHQINFNQRKVYIKDSVRKYKSDFKMLMPKVTLEDSTYLEVSIKYAMDWFTRAGQPKRKDGANLDKATHDAIAEKLKVDDCHIFKWKGEKIQSPNETFIEVTLREMSLDEVKVTDE